MPAAGGRRSHRKSRSGCLQCKRRKVKCDEGKPSCHKCLVHGVECLYSAPVSSSASHREGVPSPATTIPASGPSPPPTTSTAMASGGSDESMAPGVLTVFDLELLHHYTTSTCYTLSQASAVQAVWRDKVPRLSFGMPPLLHTILAVAALHLARSEPGREEQCLAQAQRHYTIAISTVVPVMPLLASQHCGTLFVFSSMMCIVACARPPDSANFLVLFEHGHISEWIRLVRGIKAVLDLGSDEFTTGPLAPIFVNGAFLAAARHDPSVLEQGRLYLWGVAKLVTKHCAHEPALLAIYRDALDELARTMAVVMKSDRQHLPPEPGLIFAWLLEVSDEYLNLLQEGEPLALLIFAYFSIAIRQVEWIWWMEGLSDRLIAQLRSTLHAHHPDWVPHLPSGDLYQI